MFYFNFNESHDVRNSIYTLNEALYYYGNIAGDEKQKWDNYGSSRKLYLQKSMDLLSLYQVVCLRFWTASI